MNENLPKTKPVYPNIRYCSREELDSVLLNYLEGAAGETPCDIDQAMILGAKVRENALNFEPQIIESLLMQFLAQSPTPSKIETAAWFLWTFWTGQSQPNSELVGVLSTNLALDLPYAEVQEALILCLGKAFGLEIDRKQKGQIHAVFLDVSKSSKFAIEFPMAAKALDQVLNSTEFS